MARWLAKAAIQRGISLLPHPEPVNHFFQRRVTRRVPIPDQHLLKKVEWAARHLRAVLPRLGPPATVSAFEFGAGWDLTVPLTYWMAGIDQQVLIDIEPHVRLELANHTLARLAALHDEVTDVVGQPMRPMDPTPLRSLADLQDRFGVRYMAPVDAAGTGLPSGGFELITTSDTLEHVPADALVPILRECRRLLADGGVMSHLVDMMDHYRYVDPSITVYNFLKYSDRAWRWLNSPIEPQNRLRLPDYRRVFEDAGLQILDEEVKQPREDDLDWLRTVDLAPRFRDYELEDLAAKSVRITATPLPG